MLANVLENAYSETSWTHVHNTHAEHISTRFFWKNVHWIHQELRTVEENAQRLEKTLFLIAGRINYFPDRPLFSFYPRSLSSTQTHSRSQERRLIRTAVVCLNLSLVRALSRAHAQTNNRTHTSTRSHLLSLFLSLYPPSHSLSLAPSPLFSLSCTHVYVLSFSLYAAVFLSLSLCLFLSLSVSVWFIQHHTNTLAHKHDDYKWYNLRMILYSGLILWNKFVLDQIHCEVQVVRKKLFVCIYVYTIIDVHTHVYVYSPKFQEWTATRLIGVRDMNVPPFIHPIELTPLTKKERQQMNRSWWCLMQLVHTCDLTYWYMWNDAFRRTGTPDGKWAQTWRERCWERTRKRSARHGSIASSVTTGKIVSGDFWISTNLCMIDWCIYLLVYKKTQ